MSRIEKLQKIVAEKQYAKIDGVIVDAFTAQHILQCYEAGNDKTKRIIETARIQDVGEIALRMVSKSV